MKLPVLYCNFISFSSAPLKSPRTGSGIVFLCAQEVGVCFFHFICGRCFFFLFFTFFAFSFKDILFFVLSLFQRQRVDVPIGLVFALTSSAPTQPDALARSSFWRFRESLDADNGALDDDVLSGRWDALVAGERVERVSLLRSSLLGGISNSNNGFVNWKYLLWLGCAGTDDAQVRVLLHYVS